MTARKIEKSRSRKLGTVRQGSKGVSRDIEVLSVYPDASGKGSVVPVVEVQIPSTSSPSSKTRYFMFLSPEAALEVVKGLLQNLPPMYVAADDELLAIIRIVEGDVARETAAINRVLAERRGPTLLDEELDQYAKKSGREAMADELPREDAEDSDFDQELEDEADEIKAKRKVEARRAPLKEGGISAPAPAAPSERADRPERGED